MLTIRLKIKNSSELNLDNARENRIIIELRYGTLSFPQFNHSK